MKVLDAHALLSLPATPIRWAIEGVLPEGTVGDIFGPPGEGKSSFVLDLALSISCGSGTWFGLKCVSGPVVILGGERSGVDALGRDLHRVMRTRKPGPGKLLFPSEGDRGCPQIWVWKRRESRWGLTTWGEELTEWIKGVRPVLIIIDTLLSAANGSDLLNNPQQYELGTTIRQWSQYIGGPTVLTVSHTNQASNRDSLESRLHFLSRAGGNGLPGALRWVAGVSRLREDDPLARSLGLSKRAADLRLLAFCVSKYNEMPPPVWGAERPSIFEVSAAGELLLINDGREICKPTKQKRSVCERKLPFARDLDDF